MADSGFASLKELLEASTDLYGFADLAELARVWPDLFDNFPYQMPHAISIGVVLSLGVLDTIEGQPNPLYFSHYRQANYKLDRLTLEISTHIEKLGYKAIPIPASQVIARNPMKGAICHRRIAWQAGLGSRGLNNLLVTPEFGSAQRLASVLTDMPLECGTPIEDACDMCGICRSDCPAGAIGEEKEDFNLDACRTQLDEFAKLPFVSQHICGICISACRSKRK